MAGRERKKITLEVVRQLGPNEEAWDSGRGSVTGFGVRRQTGEAVAYVLLYRTAEGRSRRFTIGRHGAPWTPDQARDEARRRLGDVARGADPASEKKTRRQAATVSELCDAYLADAQAGRLLTRRGAAKKASTLLTDRSRIESHIRPLLGSLKLPAVTRGDVEQFMHAVAEGETAQRTKTGNKRGLSNVRGGKGAASRTVGLLGAIFTYAARKGMLRENPVRGVTRFADGTKERRLSDGEYAALGTGLAMAAAPATGDNGGRGALWPAAVAATRFLAVTGWRSGEALNLRWGMVDLARHMARLPDTKTGVSLRPLSVAACEVLSAVRPGEPDMLVFPASRGRGVMTGFPSLFARITKLSGLPADVTPHILRHSFMSVGNDLGFTEATIGMICGHKGHGGGTMTRGYIHAGDAVFGAADRIAETTLRKLAGGATADVVAGFGAGH